MWTWKAGRQEGRARKNKQKKRVSNLDRYHLLHAPDSHDVILLFNVLFPSKQASTRQRVEMGTDRRACCCVHII